MALLAPIAFALLMGAQVDGRKLFLVMSGTDVLVCNAIWTRVIGTPFPMPDFDLKKSISYS